VLLLLGCLGSPPPPSYTLPRAPRRPPLQALELEERNGDLAGQLSMLQRASETGSIGAMERQASLEEQLLSVTQVANGRATELSDLRAKVAQLQHRLRQVGGA
jgi:hypothetical protein